VADVFISYSKPDRSIVARLSAYLEAQGYSAWRDDQLDSAAPYRDRIDAEISAARAVIVIWTNTSTSSAFVRGEAGRALRQDKLVPVTSHDVAYESIPLPFSELHTTDVSDESAILRTVTSLVTAPPRHVGALTALFKKTRYELFVWAGVIGGALTLVSNIHGLVQLSNVSRWIVDHWVSLLQRIWTVLLVFGFSLSGYDTVLLTICVFVAANIVFSSKRAVGSESVVRHIGSVGLPVALLIICMSLLSSFSAVSSERRAVASRALVPYVDRLFPNDVRCRHIVSEFAETYLTRQLTRRLLAGSLSTDELAELARRRADFDACAQSGNVHESTLRAFVALPIASKEQNQTLWRDDEGTPSVALSVYITADEYGGLQGFC
jgi:hypothetical protein